MWPLGHLAVGYLCYTFLVRRRTGSPPGGLSVGVLAFGSQFPDLVDKSLAWGLTVLPAGRSFAHSLLVLVPICLLVAVLADRYDRRGLAIAFAVGALSHVLVDATPMLWSAQKTGSFLLWPLLSVEVLQGPPSIRALFRSSLSQPWFYLEFVLAAIALVMWRRDGVPGIGVIRLNARVRS